MMKTGENRWFKGFYVFVAGTSGVKTDYRKCNVVFVHETGADLFVILDVERSQQAIEDKRNVIAALSFAKHEGALGHFY